MIYCRKRPNEQKQRNQLFICTKFNLQIYNSFIYTASKKKKKKWMRQQKKQKTTLQSGEPVQLASLSLLKCWKLYLHCENILARLITHKGSTVFQSFSSTDLASCPVLRVLAWYWCLHTASTCFICYAGSAHTSCDVKVRSIFQSIRLPS